MAFGFPDQLWSQSFPTGSSLGGLAGQYGGLNLQPMFGMSPENANSYQQSAQSQYRMETERLGAAAPIESARLAADSNRYVADAQAGAQRYGYDAQRGIAQLQAQNALDLLTKKQGFSSGLIDRFFGTGGAGGTGGIFGQIGAGGLSDGGAGPEISVGSLFTPSQVQSLTNSQVAGNDARYAAELGDLMRSFGASGFSPSASPMAAALRSQLLARNIGANSNARLSTNLQTAQANANQLLSTQKAREDQFSNRRKELAALMSAFSPMFSV